MLSSQTNYTILGNCQARGLANALSLLHEELIFSSESPPTDLDSLAEKLKDIANSQSVLFLTNALRQTITSNELLHEFDRPENIYIPTIFFTAFHPDIQYAYADGSLVKNGFGADWNSRLLLWAYLNDVSQSSARDLFNEKVYRAIGYFDKWSKSSDALQLEFKACDFEYSQWIKTVQRSGVFMYGVNHPTQLGITQLAIQISEKVFPNSRIRSKLALDYSDDFLSNVRWPIYPEIAERMGVEGSYFWRSGDSFADLSDFTQMCYSAWDALDLQTHALKFFPDFSYEEQQLLRSQLSA